MGSKLNCLGAKPTCKNLVKLQLFFLLSVNFLENEPHFFQSNQSCFKIIDLYPIRFFSTSTVYDT